MGNLFLKERESWWVWLSWGLIGSLISTYIFSNTSEVKLALIASGVIVSALSGWMNYSRRFEFYRALKVLLFVGSLSLLPLALNVALPVKEFSVVAINFTLVSLGLFCLCMCGAWFARRPKQYY
ncbi:hypothetical protein J8L98_18060 [Pseudoalteromonas sp. MMG013]|uniref:Uncharacterized protein n=1 Tax=Pseudoalteromonas aurantia 208 TaxID=1314867 RepID=A0ABR9EAQ9_9GAMM|nr:MULTISPECIES: hypothetical protein [Pseudoalteromonas]MBE0368081.1 hypothetical protein [Pseudoalteromonas aurantia 208]MBQ4847653.1 hypothetical protein [Pseudoalteromonas sp. MMG005]MBQ4852041.1 hypothetical protein [Pseudoalteromonas sp. MMG012]MBQ4863589.1 hypothetical protein [Pseudoalteromonas sp. MMG013]